MVGRRRITKDADATGKASRPALFHHHSYMRDTISVQRRKNAVNDDEEHEENPHLEDFLVPQREGDVERPREGAVCLSVLQRPPVSIMHNRDCPSRHSCEVTENKRKISFHEVTVRDYDMVLGDHPNCSYGPPVTLGWHYTEYQPLDLNEYEYHHSRRRPLRQLCLNYYRRMNILEAENTKDELRRATREVSHTKIRRAITRKLLPCWKIFDVSESASRKFKRLLKRENERHLKTWESEDELDWSVHSKSKSILRSRHGS